MKHACQGFPEWHACPVLIPIERKMCSGCLGRQQQAALMGMAVGSLVRVGTILEDFNAPVLVCRCGGDPSSPHHECSLNHIEWAWRQAHA